MWMDLAIVLAFVAYSVTVGFRAKREASRSLTDYFLAGRSLKGWQAGCSMAATQYAADTPLLVTGLVATAGIFSLWRLWVYAIAFLLMGFVLGGCWRRAGALTDAELTELRYSGTGAAFLRAFKAIHLGTVINCTVLAMVLIAATRLSEPFLFWHKWLPDFLVTSGTHLLSTWNVSLSSLPSSHPDVWLRSFDNLVSIFAIVSFTTLYATTGGLRSVVRTDVLQLFIAMVATGCYAWIVVNHVGGLGALGQRLGTLYGAEAQHNILSFGPIDFGETTLLFLGVLGIQWFAQVSSDGTGYLAQRTMACQTDRDARQAAVIFTFVQVVIRSLFWIPLALGLLLLYPVETLPKIGEATEAFRVAREGTFAFGIRDFLPVGMRGLMLTGMLAALASTVDTHLNWGASYWTNDIYKRFVMEQFLGRKPKAKELVWVARLSNIGILLIAIFVMTHLSSIQTAWHISLLFGSGLGVILILRWVWYRVNQWSELSALAVSLILAPVLLFAFPDLGEGERLLILVLVSTAVVLLVTFVTPAEPAEKLVSFFKRVHPPGFWGPIAKLANEDSNKPVREFGKVVRQTAFASVSVFALLVGIGSLLVGVPAWGSMWVSLGLIFLALILTPFWWDFKDKNND
jgi:solute:Na+ symporter, SSS family